MHIYIYEFEGGGFNFEEQRITALVKGNIENYK